MRGRRGLERAFRDLYTGIQHVFIGEKSCTDAACIYLGLAEDQFGFWTTPTTGLPGCGRGGAA